MMHIRDEKSRWRSLTLKSHKDDNNIGFAIAFIFTLKKGHDPEDRTRYPLGGGGAADIIQARTSDPEVLEYDHH
jgi:hypothetical protein